MSRLTGILGGLGRAMKRAFLAIRAISLGSGPMVISDRVAMFGDDPANDPRRMDFDPNRPVHRKR
ncbi:MAG: hypothetical protein K5924_04080 [Chloroflexi bacterium]|nr:hypothetical protein [Chloroflexota bacterium]